jgi:hypothetical protein
MTKRELKQLIREVLSEIESDIKVGDYIKINAPDDLDWHNREGIVVSEMGDVVVVKLSDTGAKLSVHRDQLVKVK